ncbi:aminotransferase class I/II-fold pyridoxal phosphate-dependent enzyme [Streptomyces sp. NPDC048277]|uniref:aminotransferase class I/II-fold pyridoxal phosphate-dependent enzyme n=1 Tax=Streptomyces sp. NPDC048277 TaxID=3155027 RepID=UPI0033D49A25
MTFGTAAPVRHEVADRGPALRHWRPGIVQHVPPPGLIDLGPGYPAPALLPVGLLRAAYQRALDEYGPAALAYGHNTGALSLREALAERATLADGHPCGPDQVLLTAGTSQALHFLSGLLGRPGDTVITDQYSYDLARRIFSDCGLRVRPVAMDGLGTDPESLREAVRTERAARRRVAFVYVNPTFHNPTGIVVPLTRRRELLDVAREYEVMVIEDDAYAELALDTEEPVPPSFAALAGYQGVLRLGTFAKTLAPGLRLGWLLGEPALVAWLGEHGMLVSGGSLNHTTSLAVATVLRGGDYHRHLALTREELGKRRDALAGPLCALLGERFACQVPGGGFFLWLGPAGTPEVREETYTAAAETAGVRLAPGSRFGTGHQPRLRLAYSFNPPAVLTEAAHRLAAAWTV